MSEQLTPPTTSTTNDNTGGIVQVILNYIRYWPWFLLSVIVFVTISFLDLRYTPNIYETNAKIKILDEGESLGLPMENLLTTSNSNPNNEIEILTSYRIMEKVVQELQLNEMFYEEGNIRATLIDRLPFSYQSLNNYYDSNPVTGNFNITVTPTAFEIYDFRDNSTKIFPNHNTSLSPHNLPFQIKIETAQQVKDYSGKQFTIRIKPIRSTALALKGSLKVSPVSVYSDILQLKITGENVSRSEKILNGVIKVFNEDGIEDRQLISKRTLEFIDERFLYLSEELDSIETDKKDFKQDNNLINLEVDAGTSLQNKSESELAVFEINNQLSLTELIEAAIIESYNKTLPINVGLENPVINTLINTYNTTILEKDKLSSSGGANNPMVKRLELKLADLRTSLDNSLETYKNQLKLSKNQLLSRDSKFRSEVYNLPQKEKLLRAIDRQQSIKESLYLLLLQKREEAAINLAVTEPSIKVVEYALSNSYPISPNPKSSYLKALALGLLIPFGILYIIFFLDNKIHDKEDLDKLIPSVPVVGEIPKIKNKSKTLFSNPNDRSILAESFRILSSNVNYLIPPKDDGKGSVIYVTSTIKGEGKTFISLNLSLAISSLNKKVLLIGADLRNPQLHAHLGIDKKGLGLSNYLHDTNDDWKDFLIKGFEEQPGHYTLTSGQIPPNPPHLLANGRFEELLEEAKTLYDYIIVDTAPTISVTDTLLISKFADVSVYVTRADFTEKKLLNHAKSLADNSKLKNMAFVINQVGANKRSKYGYNYGYGYGYGDTTHKKTWRDRLFKK